jgi:KaiC/GvpD/RAD55 family RecA-like ATPase
VQRVGTIIITNIIRLKPWRVRTRLLRQSVSKKMCGSAHEHSAKDFAITHANACGDISKLKGIYIKAE